MVVVAAAAVAAVVVAAEVVEERNSMVSKMTRVTRWLGVCGLLLVTACGSTAAATTPQVQHFDTPEQAVQAMSDLIGTHDAQAIERVFGAGSMDALSSGDPAADAEDFQRVKQMILDRVTFEDVDDKTKVALLGKAQWPWPIPLVHDDQGWHFDLEEGREELLNRRIGRNELFTLQALHEVVDAQHEYSSASHDGLPPSYARKFLSSEGKHDGLYWVTAEGEELSPLGDLFAEADPDVAVQTGEPQPYHGYYYRILTAQDSVLPGFTVVAWPAKYRNSGVMTFIVNQRGIVFQKDLGPETGTLAEAIGKFNPDQRWTPTGDSADASDDDEAAP